MIGSRRWTFLPNTSLSQLTEQEHSWLTDTLELLLGQLSALNQDATVSMTMKYFRIEISVFEAV